MPAIISAGFVSLLLTAVPAVSPEAIACAVASGAGVTTPFLSAAPGLLTSPADEDDATTGALAAADGFVPPSEPSKLATLAGASDFCWWCGRGVHHTTLVDSSINSARTAFSTGDNRLCFYVGLLLRI